jgi:hypothetical protein
MTTARSTAKLIHLAEDLGDGISYSGPVTNKATGTPFNFTGWSVADAKIVDGSGNQVGQWTVTLAPGQLTFSLSESAAAAIGAGTWRWRIRLTNGTPQTWMKGTLQLKDPFTA